MGSGQTNEGLQGSNSDRHADLVGVVVESLGPQATIDEGCILNALLLELWGFLSLGIGDVLL